MENKLNFISKTFPEFVGNLKPEQMGRWGKMNAHQMVEHCTAFLKLSSNQLQFPLVSAEENLPKLKAFLLSDLPFKENTKAPKEILPEEPHPIINPSYEIALEKLAKSIADFEEYFDQNPGATTPHPVFGFLNYAEWVQLHYKHLHHHFKQFGRA